MVEALPLANNLNGKFGKYSNTVKVVGDKIIYYRHRLNYSDDFPASDCAELAKFYETIYKADHARVVLVKKE